MLADLQAMRPGEVVEMVQQMAAEMEAEAEVDTGSGGSANELGWAAAGAAADHPATQARSIGSAAPTPPSAAKPAAAAGAAVGEAQQPPVPGVPPPQPPLIELQQEQATQQQELAAQQQQQATQQQQRQEQEQQPAQQQKERQQEQQHQEQQERQQLAQQEQEQQKEQQQPSQHQQEHHQQRCAVQQHQQLANHQGWEPEQEHPPPQQPVAAQPSSATAAASGDASASDYLGVRPARGGCGGWLAEVSVWLGFAGQADPGGQRQRQAVPVATELGERGRRREAWLVQRAWAACVLGAPCRQAWQLAGVPLPWARWALRRGRHSACTACRALTPQLHRGGSAHQA